jgi:hypothetical protein
MPYIRAYNSTLSFASIGANADAALIEHTDGIYTFRIHGSMYHRLGSLLPQPGEQPGFAQLYFYDTDHEVDNRLHHMDKLDRHTVMVLQNMIRNENRFYQVFQQALDERRIMNEVNGHVDLPGHNIPMQIVERPELDNRRFNRPTSVDVAVILPDGDSGTRDVRVLLCGGTIQYISEMHPDYTPLAYVLLFPTGSPAGWHPSMLETGVNAATPPRRLTCRMHAAFRLLTHPTPFSNHLHVTGKLFHQYIVDCYAQVEQGRLNCIRQNQAIAL